MNIVDKKDAVNKIVDLIMAKARYQKIVFCLDENSDTKLLDKVCRMVGRDVVIMKYYYNPKDVNKFFNMINNGVRIVLYDVSVQHFYKVQNSNNYLLNVFIVQSDFTLPYISNVDSLYGENMMICNKYCRDYCFVLFMYELALDDIWSKLLQGVNVSTDMFKRIDNLLSCEYFYYDAVSIFKALEFSLSNGYRNLDEKEICIYIYFKICCILRMLQTLDCGEERYVDFYKYMKSGEDIDKAYQLVVRSGVIEILKLYCKKLIKILLVIIDRIKLLIKKYLNNKNIKFKKIIKTAQNEAMSLNIDNLLYIANIFNCIKNI